MFAADTLRTGAFTGGARAVLEVPASLLTFRINNVTQQTALIEAIAAQQAALANNDQSTSAEN